MWRVNSGGSEVRGKMPEGTNGCGNLLWRVIRSIVGLIEVVDEVADDSIVDATRYRARVRVMPVS